MRLSKNYWTVNINYRLPRAERRELQARLKLTAPHLHSKMQARNTHAQALALAEQIERLGFPVEVNETADLAF